MRSILLPLLFLLAARVEGQAPGGVEVGSVYVPLPPDAVVVPHPHGRGHFGGIRVKLEERVIVELAALPPSPLPLPAYLDSSVRSRNATARPAWRLAPPEMRIVAGRDAWVLHPTCGDCEAVEVYIDFPGTRLVADWGVDGIPPLTTAERHRLAWRFLEGLRPAELRNGEPAPAH